MDTQEISVRQTGQIATMTVIAASAVIVYGAYGDPEPKADQQAAVPFLIVAAMLAAALVFGWLLPRAVRKWTERPGRTERWAIGLSGIGLLVVPVLFWSGLPMVLGGAGALLGYRVQETESDRTSPLRRPAVLVGVLAMLADVTLIILSNTL